MGNRRRLGIADWFDAVAFLAVGLCLGLALDGLLELDGATFWVAALAIPITFWGLIAVAGVADRLIEKIFPLGIKPARAPQPKERKPLAVLFSLPAGVIAGMAAARLGLTGLL
jgi:hypothetical protein